MFPFYFLLLSVGLLSNLSSFDVRTTLPLYLYQRTTSILLSAYMSWFILFIAGTLEAGWLVGLQKSESFTKPYYIIFAIFSMALSLVLFSVTLKEILITTAYIVWLAVGASSISIINHYFFEQPITIQQLFCFCLIFIGVLCLKISN